jgi:hypothetical protein
MTGIRAELVFEAAESCPVAEASSTADGPVTDITWTGDSGGTVTEQVTMTCDNGPADTERLPHGAESPARTDPSSAESSPDATEASADSGEEAGPEFERVFDYGSRQVYEFERDSGEPCICEYIEETVGPVSDVYAVDGDLHVTLHAGDVAAMRDLVAELSDAFGSVRIEYLVRSRVESDSADLVPVDLRQLTDRQREVLERAHELGYFEYPRRANASEVARSLGIGSSTFIEHLNAAQSKLLGELLDGE